MTQYPFMAYWPVQNYCRCYTACVGPTATAADHPNTVYEWSVDGVASACAVTSVYEPDNRTELIGDLYTFAFDPADGTHYPTSSDPRLWGDEDY